MVASAVEDSCQMPAVGSRGLPDLGSVERSYLIGLDTKGEHSLSACTVVRGSFVARSVVLVSIEKNVRLWANLVVGDSLL